MGACDFWTKARGSSAKEAFDKATADARYEHGHGGYTGTIAEKDSFVTIEVPPGLDPQEYAEKLFREGDPRIDDKWGPAGCVHLGGEDYLFFGWASS